MKPIYTLSIVAFLLFLCAGVHSQDQVRILDAGDNDSAGRFKTQLYILQDGNLERLRGKSPSIEGSGEQVELVLRLKDLRWIEDKGIDGPIEIDRSELITSDPKVVQVASSPSSYELSPEKDSEVDIKFRVLKNGSYSLKVPFSGKGVSGQYMQVFEVEGLVSKGQVATPVGNIADLKKEWRKVDKKDEDAILRFIEKHKDNPIAIEQRLIAVAERSLLRVQKSAAKNDDEEKLWEAIGDGKDEELLLEFLDKFPNSRYAEAAKVKLGQDANVLITSEDKTRNIVNTLTKLVDNVYNLDLSHLGDVEIKLSHPDDIEIFDAGGNIYDLKVMGSKKYKISAIESGTGEQFDFNLDNRFSAKMAKEQGDFVFALEGGVSPYVVEFYKEGEETSLLEGRFEGLKPSELNEISITQSMLGNSGMDGKYSKVTIRDFTTQAVSSFPIDVDVSPSKISSKLIIGLLLGGLVLGGAFMFFRSRRQNETRKAYKEKAKVFQQTQKMQSIQLAEETADKAPEKKKSSSQPPKKITITKPMKKFVPANGGQGGFKPSGRMKITKREVKGGRLTGEEFMAVLKDDKYAFLDLTELWPDSAIKELYVSKECIKDLGKFLKEENLDKAIAEMDGAIPEVGGFLMGYHQKNEAGHIRVTMDEFVPFVPEYHDVFKIEIGTATLVQELGDAQDTHPDKDVIGWFHTHPGHGLFLSNSDLSVQRHFPQKFQIAMEIDSLTDTLDTAFFTRKMDGTINNVEHRKKGAKWFSWKKIEKI